MRLEALKVSVETFEASTVRRRGHRSIGSSVLVLPFEAISKADREVTRVVVVVVVVAVV